MNQLPNPVPPLPSFLSLPSQLQLKNTAPEQQYDVTNVFITIDELETVFPDTFNKVLVCATLYIKPAKKKEESNIFSRDRGALKMSYDKLLFAVDLNSPSGRNVIAFPLGRGSNDSFFKTCLSSRDNGDLGPGKIWTVYSPPNIDSFLGASRIPILTLPDSIKPAALKNSVRLPILKVDETSDLQHGFMYHNMLIMLGNLHVIDVNCGGLLCDALDMYKSGKTATQCACYTINKRTSVLCLLVSLKLVTPDDKEMYVYNYTSKRFTDMLLKNIGPGTTATHFNSDRRIMVNLTQTVERFLSFVNGGGNAGLNGSGVNAQDCSSRKGFSVQGWVRRGDIVDQGVEAPTGPGSRHEPALKVQSGELTYHITSIVPSCLDILGDIDAKRYDARGVVPVAVQPVAPVPVQDAPNNNVHVAPQDAAAHSNVGNSNNNNNGNPVAPALV